MLKRVNITDILPDAPSADVAPEIPVISEGFLEELRQDPVQRTRLAGAYEKYGMDVEGYTASESQPGLLGNVARLGRNTLAICIRGEALNAARDVAHEALRRLR